MPAYGRVQCLLFVKEQEESEVVEDAATLPKGYALTAPGWQNLHPIRLLDHSTPVVTPQQIDPPPNAKFHMVEVLVDKVIFDPNSAVQQIPHIFVEKSNKKLVQSLFPENANVEFVTAFRKTKFHSALEAENFQTIEKLLMAGARISYQHPDGGTLAHFAVESGSAALIELLHNCGADLNAGGTRMITPLHAAVKKKNLPMIQALFGNGACIDSRMEDGTTPLLLALSSKATPVEIIKFLSDNHADLNARTPASWAPLHVAADKGWSEACTVLLEHGVDIDVRIDNGPMAGATPLHAALKKRRLQVVKLLIDKGASLVTLCSQNRNALYYAIASNDLESVEYILNRDLDVTSAGNRSAFHLAFCMSDQLVGKLLAHGFTVDAQDASVKEVLFGAIQKNYHALVRKLLEYGADVHQYGWFMSLKLTPIHVACRHADKEMVQILLEYGADPRATRGVGRDKTPIADAVDRGKLEVVKFLVDNGITVRDRPDLLVKAAGQYLGFEYVEKLQLLLDQGASMVDKKRPSGETAVAKALLRSNPKALKLLMRYGSRFDFRDVAEHGIFGGSLWKAFLDFGFSSLDPASEDWIRKLFAGYHVQPENSGAGYLYHWIVRRKECAQILAHHIIKLEVAGKAVGQDDLIPRHYFQIFPLPEFRSKCEAEVRRMVATKTGDTEITHYDVLIGSLSQVARCTRNLSIQKALTNHDFKAEYPAYGSIMNCKVRQSNWRRELLDQGIEIFGFLVRGLPVLPYDLKEEILDFLANQDLIILQKCNQTN